MNTDMLQTFLLLAELKNYTHTANQLFVAQSTVTNRIQELEAELGNPLFIRNRKQLRLTEQGERFLSYARRIVELMKSLTACLTTKLLCGLVRPIPFTTATLHQSSSTTPLTTQTQS